MSFPVLSSKCNYYFCSSQMLKLPRKQDVWAMEFFLKLALTPNQIKFRNITNFPQSVEFQGSLIFKQQSQTKSVQWLTVLWDEMKNFRHQGFSESSGESQLTPRGVNACSCGPDRTEDVMIFLLAVVDFQAASPQEHQLHGNVPWS